MIMSYTTHSDASDECLKTCFFRAMRNKQGPITVSTDEEKKSTNFSQGVGGVLSCMLPSGIRFERKNSPSNMTFGLMYAPPKAGTVGAYRALLSAAFALPMNKH